MTRPPTDAERLALLRAALEAARGDWHEATALWSVSADMTWLLERAEAAQEAPAPEGLRELLDWRIALESIARHSSDAYCRFVASQALAAIPPTPAEPPRPGSLAYASGVASETWRRAGDLVRAEARPPEGRDTALDIVRALPGFVPGMTVTDESTGFGLEPSPFGDEADWLQRGVVLSALAARLSAGGAE